VLRAFGPTTGQPDFGSQAFAEAFARAFLSWDSTARAQRAAALRRFSTRLADASEGLALRGRQTVRWTAIAGDELADSGRRVTVLVGTNRGVLALAVTVNHDHHGQFELVGPPAVVGMPAAGGDAADESRDPLDDPAVESTVNRALQNFLAGRRDALSADLAPGARVLMPRSSIGVASPLEMWWAERGAVVQVAVRARLREDGSELPLGYRIGVVRRAGRWFVSWIDDKQPLGSEVRR
jgi:hypothetical protein